VTAEERPEGAPPSASSAPPGAPAPAVPELPPVPGDADDTRGDHFRRLATAPLTLTLTGLVALAALLAVGASIGWALGLGAAVGVTAVALVIVFAIASSRAADDFFRAYADGRRLARVTGHSSVPPVTPLLRKGDERYAEQRFSGVLPGGLDGSLCLYTYEEETRDSEGNRQTTYVHYTIVITQLPDTAPFVKELFCNRRFGFRFLDSAEDVFRKRQRVEHESEAVDKEFEIFTGETDDLNRARQILSPSFLVWLESHSPEKFAFELVAGSLVASVKGHKKSAAELDLLCEASAAVARRLHDEATELTAGPT
jgi:hypothetical protein